MDPGMLALGGVALLVAYANGANDNLKGVATLYGSGTLSYRAALLWATVATVLGALATVFLAPSLAKAFSGQGLVEAELAGDPLFALAVLAGAAATVWLATFLGFPISTTHALLGGLVGAGLVASGGSLRWEVLVTVFVLPLLLAPLVSLGIAFAANGLIRRLAPAEPPCVCVDPVPTAMAPEGWTFGGAGLRLTVDRESVCVRHEVGEVLRARGSAALRGIHLMSGGAVCFARALNDTPKVVGLLLAWPALGEGSGVGLVALVMGGAALVQGRRVADRMARQITPMTQREGAVTNLATSGIVILASALGLPASTTHVSCGSLFGLGALHGEPARRTVVLIAASWVLTLPIAGLLAAAMMIVARA